MTSVANSRNGCERIVDVLKKINFYAVDESLVVDDQRLASRIYLSLLALSLVSLLLFTGSALQTRTVTIASPSRSTFERLSSDYPSTLVCPCSNISISYDQFLTFSPAYHPLCSSQFVDPHWISSLFNTTFSNAYPLDFRLIASSHFGMLAALCRTAIEAVSHALTEFSSSRLISTNTFSRSMFTAQSAAFVEQMQRTTVADVHRIDRLLSFNLEQNRLFSGLRTNFYVSNVPGSNGYVSYEMIYAADSYPNNVASPPTDVQQQCLCSDSFDCHSRAALFNVSRSIVPSSVLWPYPSAISFVPGMTSGCISRNALSQSTLECLFDSTCLTTISAFLSAFSTAVPLDRSSNSSRFPPNRTVQSIFAQLMIESWQNNSHFHGYFQQCAPAQCTYSYAQRFSLVYMITTLVGLFGGLNVVMRLISPFIVKLVRRVRRGNNTEDPPVASEFKDRARALLKAIRTKVREFNLFKETFVDTRHGIHSTRIYLLLLASAIVILTVYLSIITRTQSVTIANPSLEQFERLYAHYPSTVTCPCERLSTEHATIITVRANYHQICSSVLIDDTVWLRYWPLSAIDPSDLDTPGLFGQDFRITGQTFFHFLQLFCELASETVADALTIFNTTSFVSARALSREEFLRRTSTLIEQFIKTTTDSFAILFDSIYSTLRRNHFLVYSYTNAVPTTRQLNGSWQIRYTGKAYRNGNNTCYCDRSKTCTRPQGFYCQSRACHVNSATPTQIVPGLSIGCLPVDSILLSTLQCFFDQSCIDMLIDWRLFDFESIFLPVNFTGIVALDERRSHRFLPNTTLETIIANLFVEDWTTQTQFDSYFHQCRPQSCTYTFIEHYQWIFILTSVIGLMGGLNVVLRLLVPPTLTLFRRVQSNEISLIARIRSFNVYERETDSTHQLLATRIYLVILGITIIIIATFMALQQQTHAFTVESPTEIHVAHLRLQYPSTLSCPCTQIAVRYETFLNVSSTLHEICSSPLISSEWSLALLNRADIWRDADWFLLSTHFRLLSSMCELAQQTIDQSVFTLTSNELINREVLARDSFEVQMNTTLALFIEQLPGRFCRMITFIWETCRANQLLDRYMSSWQMTHSTAAEAFILRTVPIVRMSADKQSCICAAGHMSCSKALTFLDTFNRTITLPGVVDGCLPIDGLRQSTLECWYDQQCFSQLAQLINYSMPIVPLNSSRSIRFASSKTAMGTMMDQLFIESWLSVTNYSDYYRQCAPAACHYSYVERNDLLYVITTLLGVYGGLTVALRLLVWHGIKLFLLVFTRCRQASQIDPMTIVD